MTPIVLELLSIFFHGLSFILGLYLVKKHEGVFTRVEIPKKKRFCVDNIEVVYFVVVLSVATNLWFMFNQTVLTLQSFDNPLKDMAYSHWMWYHTGTGVVMSMLHLVLHRLLLEIKNKPEVKTNWKL